MTLENPDPWTEEPYESEASPPMINAASETKGKAASNPIAELMRTNPSEVTITRRATE